MKPFTVLLGIVLGSSAAIAFGLTAVMIIFWVLEAEYPRVAAEIPDLAIAALMFTALTAATGLGFLGVVRERPWRYMPLTGTWVGLAAIAWYYWPA